MQRSTTELRARVLDTITRSYFTHKPGGGKACERFFEARSASARRSAKFGHGERRLPYQLFEHRAPHLADRTFELRLANVMDASPVGIFPTQFAPEHRAVVHERPVPFARPRMVERRLDERHDLLIAHVLPVRKKMMDEYAPDIGLNECNGCIERECGDGVRRRMADAREGFQNCRIARQSSAELPQNAFGDARERNGAPVVAHPLPSAEHARKRRIRQGAEVRKSRDELGKNLLG